VDSAQSLCAVSLRSRNGPQSDTFPQEHIGWRSASSHAIFEQQSNADKRSDKSCWHRFLEIKLKFSTLDQRRATGKRERERQTAHF
jgi:hypothetical protein